MAANIELITYAGSTVTPQDDALVYENATAGNGMIYGAEVTLASANTLHVNAGHAIACGRKISIEDCNIQIPLTSSGTVLGRLYVHMDLSNTGDPVELLYETGASLTPVQQDSDVNINNGVYDFNLATFSVDTSTISNLVNVAPQTTTGSEMDAMIRKSSDEYAVQPYTKGDYVIHDNAIYVCNTDCVAAPWSTNSGYFTLTSLTEAVGTLNSNINEVLGKEISFAIRNVYYANNIHKFAYKMGNMIFVQIHLGSDTSQLGITGGSTIATLVGYAPKYNIYTSIIEVTSGEVLGAAHLDTSANLIVLTSNVAYKKDIVIQFSYLLA